MSSTPIRAACVLVLGSGLIAFGRSAPGACTTNVATHVPPPRQVSANEPAWIAAAGDIAGEGHQDDATADLLERLAQTHRLAAILPLGDLQYPGGSLDDFRRHFERSWGRSSLRRYLRPVPGNHDYKSGLYSARGYFDYFNGPGVATGVAGARGYGYYSYELGNWQLIGLNTSDGCKVVACTVGSAMYRWLEARLKQRKRPCVLAYFHHPRFQAGEKHGDARSMSDIWELLHAHGVDVVLSGHAHNFQQLAPLDASGRVDHEHGIRSFVVGTGGAPLYEEISSTRHSGALEAKVSSRFGVLLLELSASSYTWRFVSPAPSGGDETLASGRDRCREPR